VTSISREDSCVYLQVAARHPALDTRCGRSTIDEDLDARSFVHWLLVLQRDEMGCDDGPRGRNSDTDGSEEVGFSSHDGALESRVNFISVDALLNLLTNA